jgi:hypothetical protein
MKAIVEKIKEGPYQGTYNIVDRTLKLKTEYQEEIAWHIRNDCEETKLNAEVGHIIEGIELTENRSGKKIIDYKKSEPRVINRQFVLLK